MRFLAYAVVIYLTVGVFYWTQQEKFLFPAPLEVTAATPRDVHLPFEDVRILVGSGGFIHGWWIPQSPVAARTCVVFHGNGYTLGDMVFSELPSLRRLGVNLLLVDYRGYGRSSAIRPNEGTVFADADATLAWLLNVKGIGISDLFMMGRSIGSGPATYLAERNPKVAGLILLSPFSSIDEAARGVSYLRVFPVSQMLRTHFDNGSRIGSVSAPVFITVGGEDTLTPPSMARKLFDRARQPKRLVVVPHADHNDLIERGGAMLENALREFVK